jgi:hypothetical protein
MRAPARRYIIDTDRDTEAQGGFNILIGAAHREGLFVELKVGALDGRT